jgi:hypothetical protein
MAQAKRNLSGRFVNALRDREKESLVRLFHHRVAVSNRRLLAFDGRQVTFKVKDQRIEGPGRYTAMTPNVDEFIRRFLIPVLPKGFHRVRHYGLFASSNRAETIAHVRNLLNLGPICGRGNSSRGDERDRSGTAPRTPLPLLRRPHVHHRNF